jgi:hypothetical protein
MSEYDEPPIPTDKLRALFEHLDRASMDGYECTHRFNLTQTFLRKHSLPEAPVLEWLSSEGAGCDCEVMFNVAAQWEDVVRYEPPEE